MKKFVVISSILLTFVFAGNFVPQKSAAKGAKFFRAENAVPGRYIVVLNSAATLSTYESAANVEAASYELAGEYNANIERVYDSAINGFAGAMDESSAMNMSVDSRVAWVEEDSIAYESAVQSGATWGLDRIDQRSLPLSSSFQYSTTGSGVHAYTIDSGIRASHQDFGGRASVAVDYVGDGLNGGDCTGHGTHVAGTIGSATYGVAKGVRIHALRVIGCDSSALVSNIIAAANWVTANRINPAVVNMSLTLSGSSPSLDTAVANSIASGVTYSIAAGNSGYDACNYSPARVPAAITVGAIASNDARPSYSNQGPCLDIYAPGSSIVSLSNGDDVSARTMSGTSMAAPHVAGVAALYLEGHPTASPATVAQQIVNGATVGAVSNVDPAVANRLLYSWIDGSQAPEAPAQVTIIKKVTNAAGGSSSTTSFGYSATNLGVNSFSLVGNNAPPSDRFVNPNVIPAEAGNSDIVVTEGSVSGWKLDSIQCTETAGSGMTNVQNTTVDTVNRKAIIKVEAGESVTCTFSSKEESVTAMAVQLSGQVTGPNGRGLKGIYVFAYDQNTGTRYTATTNSFGYYAFPSMLTTHAYVVEPNSKRYTFNPGSMVLNLSDAVSNANFVSTR